jgi:hypothetical protein
MKIHSLLFAIAGLIFVPQLAVAQTPEVQVSSHICTDAVFKFQTNFWVNLHLFLRAESRRRGMDSPLEMPVSTLRPEERAAWEAGLKAYVGFAKLSLFDDGLVRLSNTLAMMRDATSLQSNLIDPQIASALNTAAPAYRAHVWPEHRRQDEEWIDAHCSDIQRFDRDVKKAISMALEDVPSFDGPILVDIARESGPTLAFTVGGPTDTSGHTILAPQKNEDVDVALSTIFHEISHTMDGKISDAIEKESARQRVKAPDYLWHAVTLYTTCEITKRAFAGAARPTIRLDTDRFNMFERSGWQEILVALQKDWQPYLDQKDSFGSAIGKLVRDTSK